jgi:phenylacetate-coenzyme A ligase PaaK-like adenylate-forming protein
LIRYELTDRVQVSDEPCPCGLPFSVLGRIEGRTEDVLALKAFGEERDVEIHPNLFHDVLDKARIAGWQVIQVSDARVIARIVLLGEEPGLLRDLANRLESNLRSAGADVVIDAQPVDALERNAAGKISLIKAMPSLRRKA